MNNCNCESEGKSAAWKKENAKYHAWFANQHPNEIGDIREDLAPELNEMTDAVKNLGWGVIVPITCLLGLAALIISAFWK